MVSVSQIMNIRTHFVPTFTGLQLIERILSFNLFGPTLLTNQLLGQGELIQG